LVHSPELFCVAGTQARQRVLRENTWNLYMQRFLALLQATQLTGAGTDRRGSRTLAAVQKTTS
jgi:hypothetical protein